MTMHSRRFDDLREEFADVERTKVLTVEMQNWVSSQINSQVARILFEELLGYEVRVVPRADTSKIPERLASGATDYNGEIWGAEATKQADFERWAARDGAQCFDSRFNGIYAASVKLPSRRRRMIPHAIAATLARTPSPRRRRHRRGEALRADLHRRR